MHFLNFVCVLGVFLGDFGILKGKIPQEIAWINTVEACIYLPAVTTYIHSICPIIIIIIILLV